MTNAALDADAKHYWDQRFARGSWEEAGGREQTSLFAKYFHQHMRVPMSRFSMLDIGCALGDGMPVWKKRYPQADLYGCDISEAAVLQCNERYGNIASFFTSSTEELSGVWDVIYCSNVLEHFEDPAGMAALLLPHCRVLYAMTPYKQQDIASTDAEHKCVLDKHTFDGLLASGTASSVATTLVKCPGAWGPADPFWVWSWHIARYIGGSILKHRDFRRAINVPRYPRQIIYTIDSAVCMSVDT